MTRAWHQHVKRSSTAARTDGDGVTHASKLEKRLWADLQWQERAGEISNLKRQVNYPLKRGDIAVLTPTGKVAQYRADFVFERGGQEIVADAKGYWDRYSRLKIAVFEALYGRRVEIMGKRDA